MFLKHPYSFQINYYHPFQVPSVQRVPDDSHGKPHTLFSQSPAGMFPLASFNVRTVMCLGKCVCLCVYA